MTTDVVDGFFIKIYVYIQYNKLYYYTWTYYSITIKLQKKLLEIDRV